MRLSKDGELLNVVLNITLFYDAKAQAAGQMILLRDITREKSETEKTRHYSEFSKLHHFQDLDKLLQFITSEVQNLLNVGGAMVILLMRRHRNSFFGCQPG